MRHISYHNTQNSEIWASCDSAAQQINLDSTAIQKEIYTLHNVAACPAQVFEQ